MRSDNMMLLHANNRYKYKNTVFEAETISAENTYKAPIEVEVSGKTEQNTLDGVNLLDTTSFPASTTGWGLTVDYDVDNQEFTINGTIGGSPNMVTYSFYKFLDIPFELGVNTLYKLAIKYISGSISGDGKYKVFYVGQSDIVGESTNWISCNLQEDNTVASGIAVNSYLTEMWIYFNCQANTSWTFDNYKFRVLFTTTENAAHAYEPYCGGMPSPNPDYPSTIQSVLSGTSVEAAGKNLTTISNLDIAANIVTSPGIGSFYFIKDVQYTLSWNQDVTLASNVRNTPFIVENVTSLKQYAAAYENAYLLAGRHIWTFVSNFTGLCAIRYWGNALSNSVKLTDFMLELGSTATSYQPYQSGGSATLDRDLYSGDKWNAASGEYTFEKAVYEFTGNESWIEYAREDEKNYVYYITIADCKLGYQTSLCTHFKNVNSAWMVEGVGTYCDHKLAYNKYFQTDIPTLSEWKAFLAAQYAAGTPVTIVYQRATPLTIQGTANLLKSVPRHTNIYSVPEDGGLMPSLKTTMKTY